MDSSSPSNKLFRYFSSAYSSHFYKGLTICDEFINDARSITKTLNYGENMILSWRQSYGMVQQGWKCYRKIVRHINARYKEGKLKREQKKTKHQ